VSKGTVRDDGRYWAFISYSHKDAAFGRRLHRRLEAYALPRRLVGAGAGIAMPRRLTPIFRDREEFPAAQDLSAEVRAALKESRSLIVVCSPAAAASPWVAREVELFRELHPGRPIFAAIREGDPKDSLPPLLRLAGPDGQTIEPLAADFRRGHDGWELGLLKLIAGLLGVGLDELVQRDTQRKTRRVMAVTATAVIAMLIMSVLTAIAVSARNEAERQRAAALGMIKFMHTDLRTELRGLGRMDLLAAANVKALQYLDGEGEETSPAFMSQRAQLLQAIGEDDEDHDHGDAALKRFQDAWQITHTLLVDTPNDPERVFYHAQSEYWLGYDDYQREAYASARRHFDSYRSLAARMVSLVPGDPRSWRELAFAEGNLCALTLQPPKDPPRALKLCIDALAHMERAAEGRPALAGIAVDLSDKQSWLGTAYHSKGDHAHALEHWLIQEKMLEALMKSDPNNVERRSEWIALQRSLARSDAESGAKDHARTRLNNALTVLEEMLLLDPTNEAWVRQRTKLKNDLEKLELN
jgi:tetratricopeptide (TPR) repeat protein